MKKKLEIALGVYFIIAIIVSIIIVAMNFNKEPVNNNDAKSVIKTQSILSLITGALLIFYFSAIWQFVSDMNEAIDKTTMVGLFISIWLCIGGSIMYSVSDNDTYEYSENQKNYTIVQIILMICLLLPFGYVGSSRGFCTLRPK